MNDLRKTFFILMIILLGTILAVRFTDGRTAALGTEVEIPLPHLNEAMDLCEGVCGRGEFFPLSDFNILYDDSFLFWRESEEMGCPFPEAEGIRNCALVLTSDPQMSFLREVPREEPELQELVGCECELSGYIGWLTIPMFRLAAEDATFEVTLHANIGFGQWRDGKFFFNVGNAGDVITADSSMMFYQLEPNVRG